MVANGRGGDEDGGWRYDRFLKDASRGALVAQCEAEGARGPWGVRKRVEHGSRKEMTVVRGGVKDLPRGAEIERVRRGRDEARKGYSGVAKDDGGWGVVRIELILFHRAGVTFLYRRPTPDRARSRRFHRLPSSLSPYRVIYLSAAVYVASLILARKGSYVPLRHSTHTHVDSFSLLPSFPLILLLFFFLVFRPFRIMEGGASSA